MPRRRAIAALLALLLAGLAAAGDAAGALQVLVVQSKEGGAYEQAGGAIRATLAQRPGAPTVTFQSLEQYRAAPTAVKAPSVIVTVGTQAARELAAANPAPPLLHALVPRATATELLRERGTGGGRRDSALYLDQPLGRQLDLIRLALPQYRNVGALLGPSSEGIAAELRTQAAARDLAVEIATMTRREELLPTLNRLLDDADVLLSVADPLVYSSETIHHLLLTTYRYKVPVVGISKAYVEAGALLAVYSTPEQIGRQAGEILAALPARGALQLPLPQYPRYFSIAINRRVAASLDLHLEDEAALAWRLEALSLP
jgi:ABC-type uncharacterized transport system substrate-binding protein